MEKKNAMTPGQRATKLMEMMYGHRWDDDPYEHIDKWQIAEAQFEAAIESQQVEITKLQALNEGLAERVAKQSELLSKRAEKPPEKIDPKTVDSNFRYFRSDAV